MARRCYASAHRESPVTSNPSPAYVSRISAVFADNGRGERGDLAAVVRAILLDPEATQRPTGAQQTSGKLQEPVVRYVSLLRQFEATSDDGFIAALGFFLQELTRQHPLSAPSVFNFYLPSHAPAGDIAAAGLVAPEFQIADANAIVGWPNLLDAILFGDFVTDAPQGFDPVRLQLEPYFAIASDVDELIDRLDTVLTGGALDSGYKAELRTQLALIDQLDVRVQIAIYLVAISPDAMVVR
ncbi:MAG: DUF1800 family protein [Pseudomonadota bacterium]